MGMSYQESLRLRKTAPMTQDEIINYYRSNGEVLPDRYADTEQARRNEITKRFRPYEIRQDERFDRSI